MSKTAYGMSMATSSTSRVLRYGCVRTFASNKNGNRGNRGGRAMRSRSKWALTLTIALIANAAAAQDYPSRPLSIIVTPPPGSTTDVVIRHYGSKFQEITGQPLIVQNRPGAGGNIGAVALTQA